MTTVTEFAAAIAIGNDNLNRLQSAVNDVPGNFTTSAGTLVPNLRKRLEDIGYMDPVPFVSGLSATDASFTVTYLGATYSANSAVIPFVTTGVFNPAQWVRPVFLDEAEAARDEAVLYGGVQVNTLADLLPLTSGQVAVGAYVLVKQLGVWYKRVASGGDLTHTAAVLAWEVQIGADGRWNIAGWGVVKSPTDTTTALQAAAATGRAFNIGVGDYTISTTILPADGFDLQGPSMGVATIYMTTADLAHFRASNMEKLRWFGVGMTGASTSVGAAGDGTNRGAIHVNGITDLQVLFCEFDRLPASGVIVNFNASFSPLRYTGGIIAYNTFTRTAGSMPGLIEPDGLQDGAPVALHHFTRNLQVVGNRCFGRWSVGIRAFEFFSSGQSRITGLTIRDNVIDGADRYGMFFYALNPLVVSSYADNGSGAFRVVFTTPHYCDTGDVMHFGNAGTASGIWGVTVINATTFDLIGSTYAVGGNLAASVRSSRGVEATIENNVVQNILGSKDPGAGKPYGAGIYMQGVGGIVCRNNRLRRTNLETTVQTLTPGAYGVNGATGPVTIMGGTIEEAGYDGIVINNQNAGQSWFGSIFVGGGIQIMRTRLEAVRLLHGARTTIDGANIQTRSLSDGRGGIYAPDLSGSGVVDPQYVAIRNVTIEWDQTTGTCPMELTRLTDFAINNVHIINKRPAAQVVELVRMVNCNRGVVTGNNFDGNVSTYAALVINGTQNTRFDNNRVRMTSDGAARPTVSMLGTCTGTVWEDSNDFGTGRMANTSTSGRMNTRATTNDSGSQTRQAGDTIRNTTYSTSAVIEWIKTSASVGSANWREVRAPMAGTVTFTAATSVAVAFSVAQPSALYSPTVSLPANQPWWITGKGTGGFTINTTPALTGAVDWAVNRHGE